jgi:hypothetical protein
MLANIFSRSMNLDLFLECLNVVFLLNSIILLFKSEEEYIH